MSWLTQVAHVMAKDVAESRRLLLLYVVLVVVAMGQAIGWTALSHDVLGGTMILVVLTGLFLIAAVVQADSPTRSDAFWATHPLRPSAVAGAKVGYALLLLAIGLVGQTMAVHGFDVRGMLLASLVAHAIPLYGGLLLAAMVVAALVRDLRSFALAVVLIPIALLVVALSSPPVAEFLDSFVLPDPPTGGASRPLGPLLVKLVGAGAALGALAWLYATRDSRLGTRVAGIAVATLAAVGAAARSPEPVADDPALATRVALTLELPEDGLLTQNDALLRVIVRGAGLPAGARLLMMESAITVRLRDGSTLRLAALDQTPEMFVFGAAQALPHVDGVRWIGGATPGPDTSRTTARALVAPLTPEQRRAIRAGIASLTVAGRAVVTGTRVVATMPLTTGSRHAGVGERVRIEAWTRERGLPTVDVRVANIGDQGSPALLVWAMDPNLQLAIVNTARGEGLPLRREAAFNGLDALVLPGTPLRSATMRYMVEPNREVPDDAWFGDAQLLVTSRVARGSYPVRLEFTLP
jgi:hypothetical protein